MNRALIEAIWPLILALAVALVLLVLVCRISGAQIKWRRIARLHKCQQGGVQSLSFVLTMPVFIMIVLFIVQISQLMIATMVVHYAAYAAARSASVWIPAQILGDFDMDDEAENVLPAPIREDNPVMLAYDQQYVSPESQDYDVWEYNGTSGFIDRTRKYERIFTAAAMACAPLAPSHDWNYDNGLQISPVIDATQRMYAATVPSSRSNERIPQRLANKLSYSFLNTTVLISFVDKNTLRGPTYNPRVPVRLEDGEVLRTPEGEVVRSWNPHEIGWQDPLTLTVTHHFALLPGPARFLSSRLVRADGLPDQTRDRIRPTTTGNDRQLYVTDIRASATITTEGIKSVVPYLQSRTLPSGFE